MKLTRNTYKWRNITVCKIIQDENFAQKNDKRNAMIKWFYLSTLLFLYSLNSLGQCMQSYTYPINAIPLSPNSVAINLIQAIPVPDAYYGYSDFTGNYTSGYQYRAVGNATWNSFQTLATSATVSGLVAGTSYEFRGYTNSHCVLHTYAGYDPPTPDTYDEWDDNNVSASVSALTYPATPTLGSASSSNSTSVSFSWNAVVGAVTGYYLDLSTSSTFSAGSFVFQNISVGTSPLAYTTSNTLTPGTKYYYRVRAYNSTGASDYSIASSAISTRPAAVVATLATSITTTSFKANWNAATGIVDSYRLDVSNDNFATTITDYSDLLVNGTTQIITGLASGTTYSYQVRAVNSSGASSNSNIISLITMPVAPIAVSSTNNTASSFNANWQAAVGASGYKLDVSTTNSFSSLLTEYNDLSVNGTSQLVTGLTAGTSYYYRLRAVNASGVSGNSNQIAAKTISTAPAGQNPSSISYNTFTANWNTSIGADNYRLDVSNDNFTTTITDYGDLLVNGTTQIITGLASGTTYSYRVRAVNSSGASSNSNIISLITLPVAPTAVSSTNNTVSSFNANWQAAVGASGYKLDVSTTNSFSSLLAEYNDLSVNGTSQLVTGLTAGTSYYYRLRAVNASGVSGNSNQIAVKTISTAPAAQNPSSISFNTFTANWNASIGADNYRLDVSKDNFATTLTDYGDLLVNGTTQIITGLASGTTYSYRVRTVNSSGASSNSNIVSLITMPAAPTVISSTNNTVNSFNANWQEVVGASGYKLDVSTTSSFSSLFTEYSDLSVNGTSQLVTGLTAGTSYYYRLRAVNTSGTSENSNSVEVKTITLPPIPRNGTNVSPISFMANWNNTIGATSYRLDVSADNFTTILTNYNDLVINGTSQSVTGLQSGITYYYRIRAANEGGVSDNSIVVSQQTLPGTPQGLVASEITSSSIKISWQPVIGASEYELQVSRSPVFDNILTGYNPKIIPAFLNEDIVLGLTASTLYYFRIQSKNSAGYSESYSNIKISNTLSTSGVNDFEIKITTPLQSPSILKIGESQEASIGFGSGPNLSSDGLTVTLYHRKNSESSFSIEPVSLIQEQFKVTLDERWIDDFGMQFYFEAKDQSGQIKTSNTTTILKGIDNVKLPVINFGKDQKNYQIISFPYAIEDATIRDLFEKIMGVYNKKKWRLMKYRNGSVLDYSEGLNANKIEQGQGYWFVSAVPKEFSFGSGKSFNNSLTNPFKLHLKKGWNQIGNPFPYDLSWQDVRSANSNLPVDKLYVFDRSFIESDRLKVFGGGFVFAENDMELIFPVTLPKINGRIAVNPMSDGFEGTDWTLPIQLRQGEITNSLSGVGMRSNALEGKDLFDRVTPPRFLHYIELNSIRPTYEFDLSTDIVYPVDNYKWSFSLESNSGETVELKWNSQLLSTIDAQVILFDQSKHTLIDMARIDNYAAEPGVKLFIYFTKVNKLEIDQLKLGVPYPNPFSTEISIPYDFDLERTTYAEVTIYDLQGRILLDTQINTSQSAIKEFKWNGITQAGFQAEQGVYFYRVKIYKENEPLILSGKIIKQ